MNYREELRQPCIKNGTIQKGDGGKGFETGTKGAKVLIWGATEVD